MGNQTTEGRNPSHPEVSCEDLEMPGFHVNRERLSRSLGSLEQGRLTHRTGEHSRRGW